MSCKVQRQLLEGLVFLSRNVRGQIDWLGILDKDFSKFASPHFHNIACHLKQVDICKFPRDHFISKIGRLKQSIVIDANWNNFYVIFQLLKVVIRFEQ